MRPEVRKAHLKLFERDKEERLIGEIPRHPIGLFFIFFVTAFLILLVLAGAFFLVKEQDRLRATVGLQRIGDISNLVTILTLVLIGLIALGAAISAYIYKNNYMVLTDQKIVLIKTKSIFSRSVSQLSIGDVQDLTIEQRTLLARLFNYGTLKIETAGEQAHFTFAYAPEPHECGKHIVNAHEENLKLYGN